MNSKQRVLAAINHQDTDRVPVDFWAEISVKDNLCHRLGLDDEEQLLQYLEVDVRSIYPEYVGPELKKFPDGSFADFWGVIRKPVPHATGVHNETVFSPLADAASIRDIERARWPSPDWFDYSGLAGQCEQYEQYAICVGKMGRESQTVFIQTWYSRGFDQILLDMTVNPDLVKAMVDRIMTFRMEHVRRILEEVAGKAHFIQIADDYGTQNGLMLSPQMWREFFRPALKRLVDLIHEYGLKAFLHSCGSVRKLIPDLIEIGIDILNPIQTRARGMDPLELKNNYGQQICFHGSLDTQQTLPFGSEEEVSEEVRQRIETLGSGGGFIIAPTHTIEPDVPIKNILAMYKADRKVHGH